MPTARAYGFLIIAVILYLFGNQTQVGWLYAIAALVLGIVLAAWLINRRGLKGIVANRSITPVAEEAVEDSEAHITLTLTNPQRTGSSHLSLIETCPLAAPDSSQCRTRLFIPDFPGRSSVEFTYIVTLDRRGLHTFLPIHLESRTPFGFFIKPGQLIEPTRTLVYPVVHPLEHLALLDRRHQLELAQNRVGTGYEIMGVRPYQPGDSPRHIHWRSVARTGQLISKEFADEAHPGLTLIIDSFAYPYAPTHTKHTPFEWAVKCAASLGDYARVQGYALHLLGDDEALATPTGPLAWDSLMQYLAHLQPVGKRPLDQIIGRRITQQFVAVILAWPEPAALDSLRSLKQQGINVLAVLIDPASFPTPGPSAESFAATLRAQQIEVRVIQFGSDWARQLS
jgi:uncharacterized protein (DUF58 family)